MDGRGRALDNVFCERLGRSVKYENIYLNQYDTVPQLHTGLRAYFDFYNHERPHPSGCTLSFSFRGPNIGAHHKNRSHFAPANCCSDKRQRPLTTDHCSSEHVNISIQIGWNRPELGGHFQIFWRR